MAGAIKANTTIIKNCVNTLNTKGKYYHNKKNTFNSSNYNASSCYTLNSYLKKLQNNYQNIFENINNISVYLDNYSSDIEGMEKQMSGGSGFVSIAHINSKINNSKNINKIRLDNVILFNSENYVNNVNNSTNENLDKSVIATIAVGGLAFLEGVVNVGEMLVDGGAIIVSGACSLAGFKDASSAIGDFIKTDWSKEGYSKVIDATNLNDKSYLDAYGTGANLISTVGTIVGMVGLSVLTGGIINSAYGLSGGGIMVASTATKASAVAANAVVGGVVQALADAGSTSEIALQTGATIDDAQTVATGAAITGFATGSLSGKYDAFARQNAALGKGLGSIVKSIIASFGISSSEPIFNEIIDTVVYKNNSDLSFIDNFINNSINDGVLLQMILSGAVGALGTVSNAFGGWLSSKNVNISNTAEVKTSVKKKILTEEEIQFKINQYNDLLESDDRLKNIIKERELGHAIALPDELLDMYKQLSKLEYEIKTKSIVMYDRHWNNDYLQKIADENLTIDNNVGKQLESLFFNDDYILGVHVAGSEDTCIKINQDGLWLTGGTLSGGTNSGNVLNLSSNVNMSLKKNEVDFYNFLFNLSSLYKSSDGIHDGASIICIPKSDINFDKSMQGFSFKNPEIAQLNVENQKVLNPKYILGFVSNNDGFISDLTLNNKFLDDNLIESLAILSGKTNISKGNLKEETINTSLKRVLTDSEMQLKMDEYNNILMNYTALEDIMKKKNSGHQFIIPDDLVDMYNRLIMLDEEISTGIGTISNLELQNLEFSSFGNNINDTIQLFSVKEMLDAIVDDKVYNQIFILGDDAYKVSLANAIRDLLDASYKYGYDLNLNSQQMERAYSIVNNFSVNHVQFLEDIYNTYFSWMILSDKAYISVLDDDYISTLDNARILLGNYPSNDSLINIVNSMDEYQCRVLNLIINNDFDLKDGKKFNNFCSYFSKLLDNGNPIHIKTADYIARNSLLYNVDVKNIEFAQKMLKASQVKFWLEDIMLERFKTFTSNYVSEDKIDSLLGTLWYSYKNFFEEKGNSFTMAWNDGSRSTFDISWPVDILRANTPHESLHQLSYKLVADTAELYESRSGVRIYQYDRKLGTTINKYNGFNECITEFLNSLLLGEFYPDTHYCGYQEAVERLKILINKNVLSIEQIKQAYFENNIGIIEKSITKVSKGDSSFFDEFADAFDMAISNDAKIRKKGLNKLDMLLMKI